MDEGMDEAAAAATAEEDVEEEEVEKLTAGGAAGSGTERAQIGGAPGGVDDSFTIVLN